MRTKILLPFIVILLLGMFPGHSWLGDNVRSTIEESGLDSGVRIDFTEYESSFPLEFKASKIEAFPIDTPFPISVSCENPSGVMSLGSALLLKRKIEVKANCYNGVVSTSISGPLLSNENSFKFDVNSVDFGAHTVPRLFGVVGKISASGGRIQL